MDRECKQCGELLPLNEIYFYSEEKNGKTYYKKTCIVCCTENKRDRYNSKHKKPVTTYYAKPVNQNNVTHDITVYAKPVNQNNVTYDTTMYAKSVNQNSVTNDRTGYVVPNNINDMLTKYNTGKYLNENSKGFEMIIDSCILLGKKLFNKADKQVDKKDVIKNENKQVSNKNKFGVPAYIAHDYNVHI